MFQIAWEGKELSPEAMELSERTMAKCGGIHKVILPPFGNIRCFSFVK
jgi:hypothetical protein